MLDLSLVLPVLNEEKIIPKVVEDVASNLSKNHINFEIILVENGSEDKTLDVINNLAKRSRKIKVLVTKRGYGEAILGGLRKARGKYVGYMPSDGQVNSKILPRLLKILKNSKAEIVGIQRTTRESTIRKIRSRLFNILTKTLLGLSSKDTNGDPKIFPKKFLPILKLESKDSFLSSELLIKAKYLGLRLIEVPTISLPRAAGRSTNSIWTYLEFIRNIALYRFGEKLVVWKKSL